MLKSSMAASHGPSPRGQTAVPPYRPLVQSSIESLRESARSAACHYGQLSGLISLGRLVPAEEGRFLEAVLRQLVAGEDRLLLVDKAIALPVYDEAVDLVERNEGSRLEGLAIDPKRRARHVYRPDLVIVDKETHVAFVLDVKRSLDSYSGTAALEKLAARMLAAALTLPDLLYREHRRLYVSHTSIAIIDLADGRQAYPSGVFPVGVLDRLLGADGLVEGVSEAREAFRRAVPDLIEELAPASPAGSVGSDLRRRSRIAEPPPSCTRSSVIEAIEEAQVHTLSRPTFGLAAPIAATGHG